MAKKKLTLKELTPQQQGLVFAAIDYALNGLFDGGYDQPDGFLNDHTEELSELYYRLKIDK